MRTGKGPFKYSPSRCNSGGELFLKSVSAKVGPRSIEAKVDTQFVDYLFVILHYYLK